MKHILILLTALILVSFTALCAAEPPFPAGIEHVLVERSDSDRYQFLHDPAIEFHKGELFAAWYNCPEKEIVGESLIRCRRSKDGGAWTSRARGVSSGMPAGGIRAPPPRPGC